jgi:ribose transport system substrate-binding protein
VKLVAFDASEQLVSDLREGWIDALVVQNPFKMGYEAVRAVGLKLAGQTPPSLVDSGATLVVRENLEKPEIRELLFPEL